MTISPLYFNLLAMLVLECTIILLISLLIYLLYVSLKKKRKVYQYKIYNFSLNKLYLLCYFLIFIILFSFLRIKRVSLALDLKIFKVYIVKLFLAIGPLLGIVSIIIGTLLLILSFLILVKINAFFIKEIKKYHLFLQYTKYPNGSAKITRYHRLIDKISSDYSYPMITSRPIGFFVSVFMFFNSKYKTNDYKRLRLITKLELILKILPLLILISLIVYDCYFNNFVITKAFWYTLIYIPYIFWYRITTFFWYQNTSYNIIVYEHYYCKDRMMYVSVPKELEDNIITFISNGLQTLTEEWLSEDWLELQAYRVFSQDGRLYQSNTQYYIEENPDEDIEI